MNNPFHDTIVKVGEGVGTLDGLSIEQMITAWMYFKNLGDTELGRFVDADAWFFDLSAAQQDQVIAFGKTYNIGKKTAMITNWYPHEGAFRTETPIVGSPVTSR